MREEELEIAIKVSLVSGLHSRTAFAHRIPPFAWFGFFLSSLYIFACIETNNIRVVKAPVAEVEW